jgi:hypothetical protein
MICSSLSAFAGTPEDDLTVALSDCKGITPMVNFVRCESAVRLAALRKMGLQDMDLAELLEAKRLKIAEMIDAGQISQADVSIRLAQAASDFTEDLQRRSRARAEDFMRRQRFLEESQRSSSPPVTCYYIFNGYTCF